MTKRIDADIDIDVADRVAALEGLDCVQGVMLDREGRRRKHPSAVYFQDIPTDPLDGMAAWEYRRASEQGFFKLDFLKTSLYDGVRDEVHLVNLMTTEPPWSRLFEPAILSKLAQRLSDHTDVLEQIEPRSIEDLAVCLALIRPGKLYLRQRPRFEIMRDIWLPVDGDDFKFKKSHAIAYATALVVQLNLIMENEHGEATN